MQQAWCISMSIWMIFFSHSKNKKKKKKKRMSRSMQRQALEIFIFSLLKIDMFVLFQLAKETRKEEEKKNVHVFILSDTFSI